MDCENWKMPEPANWLSQVWKDVRADPEKPVGPNGELCGIRTDSALPRTAKQVLDEDLPGMGQFYCKFHHSVLSLF